MSNGAGSTVNATGARAFSSLVRLAVLALVVVLALPPSATAARVCLQRSAQGKISIDQQGLNIVLDLRQNGQELSGGAHYERFASGNRVRGLILSGYIDASKMQLRIRWDGLSIGQYTGTIDREGWVRGYTFDEINAGATVPWKSRRPLPCRQSFRY